MHSVSEVPKACTLIQAKYS